MLLLAFFEPVLFSSFGSRIQACLQCSADMIVKMRARYRGMSNLGIDFTKLRIGR